MNSRSIATQILCMVLLSLAGIASASKINDVRSNIYAWCKSWQSRDISRYMSFYNPNFRSEGLDYQSWMQKKAKIFKISGYIQVEISDLWVFIALNNFSTPEILTLEGDRPRVVIDIKNVSSRSGKYKTPVNGNLIKQIRTHLHPDTEKLRIVLDLNPSDNYIINQIYYQTENIYCIEVR